MTDDTASRAVRTPVTCICGKVIEHPRRNQGCCSGKCRSAKRNRRIRMEVIKAGIDKINVELKRLRLDPMCCPCEMCMGCPEQVELERMEGNF